MCPHLVSDRNGAQCAVHARTGLGVDPPAVWVAVILRGDADRDRPPVAVPGTDGAEDLLVGAILETHVLAHDWPSAYSLTISANAASSALVYVTVGESGRPHSSSSIAAYSPAVISSATDVTPGGRSSSSGGTVVKARSRARTRASVSVPATFSGSAVSRSIKS